MLPVLQKILYASDLGENARQVFAHAVGLARQHDAQITFLYVMEPLGATAQTLVRTMVPADQLAELEAEGMNKVRHEIHQRIEAFCEAELGAASDADKLVTDIRIVHGRPATTIVEQAQETAADLVVLGTHGRSGVQRALLGSVARHVIGQIDRPVLLIPIEDDIR